MAKHSTSLDAIGEVTGAAARKYPFSAAALGATIAVDAGLAIGGRGYLTLSGFLFAWAVLWAAVRLVNLSVWWNQRRILLAKYDRPAPGPLEMFKAMRAERKFKAYVTKQWAAWCRANGYVGDLKTVPALRNLRMDVAGDLTATVYPGALHVKAPKGMTAVEHLRGMTPSLAETTKCESVNVRNSGQSGAVVTFLRSDPLARVLPIAEMPSAPDDQIAFGTTVNGVAALAMTMHVLMGGMSGFGKSSFLHAVLADLNRKRIKYVLNMIDPKGGAEFREMADKVGMWSENRLINAYCKSGDVESIRVLDSVVAELKMRQEAFNGRKWTPADAEQYPLTILMIDECLEVFETWSKHKPDAKPAGKPMNDFVKILLSQGRAAGFMVIALTQTAEVSALGSNVRRMFPKRYAVATDNATGTTMILGDNAEAEGARCSKITTPGRGFGQTEGVRGYEEFRIAWADDADRERIAAGLMPEGMGEGGKQAVTRETAVYRFYSSEGHLLYVGIAYDLLERWTKHAADKPWWSQVDQSRTVVTWHSTREAAMKVEEREIKTRLPRYNKQHNGANPIAQPVVTHRPAPIAYTQPAQPVLVEPEPQSDRLPEPSNVAPIRQPRTRTRPPAAYTRTRIRRSA